MGEKMPEENVNTEQTESALSFDGVKQYLTDNKDNEDVKGFISSLGATPNKDGFEKWISEEKDGKEFFAKLTDKRVTQSIDTYKKNHMEAAIKERIEEEIHRRYPDETEEQKRIRELELKFQEKDREASREKNTNYALRISQEKGLGNLRSVHHLIHDGDSEEDIAQRLRDFEEDMNFISKQATNKILSRNGKKEISGDEKMTFTLEEIKAMSPEQYESNRAAIQEWLKTHK